MSRALAMIVTGALVAAIAFGFARSHAGRAPYVAHFDNVMGTSLDVRVEAASEAAGEAAERVVLAEIARESKILSGYDPDSEFSRWLRTSATPMKVSPELIDVLSAFDDWRARTVGALDPAVQAVSAVWQRAERDHRLPADAELQDAVARLRRPQWTVDRAASTATRTGDAPVVLNSFTKSYVADRAARLALAVPGVSGILLNAGGDIIVRGGWTQTIGIADAVAQADNAPPVAELAIRNAVVATSGGYKRGFDIGGQHYSHLIDPRTGQPAGHVLSATVVSANAVEAGALATAFCVLTPQDSAALGKTVPGVEFVLVLEGGRRVESAGWRTLVAHPARRSPLVAVETLHAADQSLWNAGWQLTITLELSRVASFGRRPYVAVWIEDKDHFPVRTLAVWYNKQKYLPELRAWFRADRLRSMAEGSRLIDAVSSPTRSAGRYVLQWDGKDNGGRLVPAGHYTVNIEAAREHGTYQIIRQDMDLSGAPRQVALPGGTEISAASLDYHQVGGR